MKPMLIIIAAALAGCSHTMSSETDWPGGREKGAVSTGIWSTNATSNEKRLSRFDQCLEKLHGTSDAAAICDKRMRAYEPKQLNWNPYYGYRY